MVMVGSICAVTQQVAPLWNKLYCNVAIKISPLFYRVYHFTFSHPKTHTHTDFPFPSESVSQKPMPLAQLLLYFKQPPIAYQKSAHQ